MSAETKRRTKPASLRREKYITVLVTAAEKRKIETAANAKGLAAGPWLRTLGLAEADKAIKPQ